MAELNLIFNKINFKMHLPSLTRNGSPAPEIDLAHAMNVTGVKFGVSKTPRVPVKPLRSARNSHSITVKDYVKEVSGMNKTFGHDFYNLPSNEMLLKKVQFGHTDKSKNKSFM